MIDKRTGKERCAFLKQIRINVAEEHGIDYKPAECDHVGDCSGTCPQCKKELQELTSAIHKEQLAVNGNNYVLCFNKDTNEFVMELNH